MEELILKYEKAKQSQIDLKQQTALTNAVQHQLLDQNIHLFDGVLNDLRALASCSGVPQANELLPHVSGSAYRDELLKKTESMEEFAKQNYEHKEYYEGLLNGLRNMRAHIKNLYRKHYR